MAAIAKVPGARGDDELARAAVAGEGQAFAELYDRHERRVYGFCLRLLGNPPDAADATQETFMRLLKRLPALDGRELNFLAYVFTVARHACYDIIQARKRVELSGEEIEASGPEPGAIEEDPERAAMLAATRELAERAHARLPERQREVLALRELEGLSYEEIGEVLELKPNAVAQLISRARVKLAELVRGDALESIASISPECDRALPLLARGQDGQGVAGEDGNWLLAHLRDCGTCRVRESAMQEAGVSYRSLAPIIPLVWLRQATIARAAELVGADWSALAHKGGKQPFDGAERGGRGEYPWFLSSGPGVGERLRLASPRRRRRRRALVLPAVCLLAVGLFAGSIAREDVVPSTRSLSPASAGARTSLAHASRKGARKRVVVHREETVRRVLPGGRAVDVKVPVTSTILVPASAPGGSGDAKAVHGKRRRQPGNPRPSSPRSPPLTTTTPTTTTTTTAATPPTTSTAPTPITPTPTTSTTPTMTTPTTTNPNTPAPTETTPTTPPGTLNPGTPAG
jgi:RNA polymerase sigma-70 factor (ECF subfamily)